jgi:hypothetical protein
MAQKTIIQLVDDIDDMPLADGEGETVTFALDGTTYEIDLSLKNADRLRGALQDYIAAGRKVGRKTGTAGKRTQAGPAAAEIRDWARSTGHSVPDRGRIPQEVRDAFDAR